MIFGMNVKVAQKQGETKTYLSIGLLCMVLSLCFHIVGSIYESELSTQMVMGNIRKSMTLEMQAWISTCTTSSFLCLWLAVMTLFQVAFQHRKTLKSVG